MIDATDAAWVVGDDGRALVAGATADLDAGADEVALVEGLRRRGLTADRASLVTELAVTRRRARDVHPSADRLLLTRTGLQQATRPRLAAWKAERFAGRAVVDLCAGGGSDAAALAAVATRLVAVEADPVRAVLLRHNLGLLAPGATVLTGDALAAEVPAGWAVHADPDRRTGPRRLRDPEQYRPSLRALDAHLRATNALGVTMGPGVDLDHPLLGDAELEFLQDGADLVEAVRWTGELRRAGARASATLLPAGEHVVAEGPAGAPLPTRAIGALLLDPAPALVRARLHDRLGEALGADVGRVARRVALLTADAAAPSPWFVRREVVAVLPARPRAVRRWLVSHDAGPVEIALAGVRVDPEAWWRELGRPPRGPAGLRIDLIRLDDGAAAVLSRGAAHPRPSDDAG